MCRLSGNAVRGEVLLAVVLEPKKARSLRVAPIVEEGRHDDDQMAVVVQVAGNSAIGAVTAVNVVPDEVQVSHILQPLHAVIRARNDRRQVQVVPICVEDVHVAVVIEIDKLNAG